ncbi:MAG: I78 family peptidase inhibitor [Simplicispira sp.]|uniref:I78 family peptidase inhibitor n=1 Tax=Simplicispira sp. TaxID=2015802 RepID=UPI00258465B2|nr:I78 family peptidase inhibitor [Simplicispira sp.]MDD2691657.1 I78 family peptidase inhibitor [Simplicispira sp.]
MTKNRIPTLLACASAALLAACTSAPGTGPSALSSPGPRGGVCNAAPAQSFRGQSATASVMEQARVASGAAMARVLHPKQATTREFNNERLNLLVDGNGRITALHCG